MKKVFSISNLYLPVYFLALGLVGIFAVKRPLYNWDMLAYMALAVKMDQPDIHLIHSITYASAKKNVPPLQFGYLLGSTYRKQMAENPNDFYNQLPFYAVKPLYTAMVYCFYKAGFSLTISTVLPSILFYVLIGVLLLQWLKKYLFPFFAFFVSLLIMYSGIMVNIARTSTPDCLSAFLLLSAFYFIIENPSIKAMFIFLLLSLFARLDNIFACILVISFLYYSKKSVLKISAKRYFTMLLLFVVGYFSISFLLRPFGLNMPFYPAFSNHPDLTKEYHLSFPFAGYLALLYAELINAIVYYHFTFYVILILFIIGYTPSMQFRELIFDQLFPLVFVLIILARFIVLPDLSDRFNIAYYLCTIILLIKIHPGPKIFRESNSFIKKPISFAHPNEYG